VQFDESRPVPPGHRVCGKCYLVKPDAAFRRGTPVCKGCWSLRDQAYYETNVECLNIYGVSLVALEGRRERTRRYYAANTNARKAGISAWQRKNPRKVAVYCAARRARLRTAAGSFTSDDIRLLFEQQDGCCFYCDGLLGRGFHVDHKVPLSRGGSNWPSNLALACASCNTQKHTMTSEQYLVFRRMRGLCTRSTVTRMAMVA